MKRSVWYGFWLLGCLLMVAASPSLASEETGGSPYLLGSPLSHKNLKLFPLHAKDTVGSSEKMLSFEEASTRKLVKVTELEGNTDAAQVNAVHISSVAETPVFIMAGEVILGGKQDRIISQDTVIDPGEKNVEVKVFCVEQGRWTGETAKFRSSGKMGHSDLRAASVFKDNQSEVWAEVAQTNKEMRAESDTDTYRRSIESADKALQGYLDALLPELAKDGKAVGIAVAIGGQIIAVDAFANPKLFAQAREKLLASYALEALAYDGGTNNDKVAGSAVDSFFAKVAAAEQVRESSSGEASLDFYDSPEVQAVEAKSKKSDKAVHTYYKLK